MNTQNRVRTHKILRSLILRGAEQPGSPCSSKQHCTCGGWCFRARLGVQVACGFCLQQRQGGSGAFYRGTRGGKESSASSSGITSTAAACVGLMVERYSALFAASRQQQLVLFTSVLFNKNRQEQPQQIL